MPEKCGGYLRDNSVLRVSRSLRDLAYRVLQCKEAMMGGETAGSRGWKKLPSGWRCRWKKYPRPWMPLPPRSPLYDPVYTDGGDPLTVMDQVRDTKNTDERWIEHMDLKECVSNLSDREKQILILRFYDGKTQMEVANQVGISQAQVSRLEKKRHQRDAEKR